MYAATEATNHKSYRTLWLLSVLLGAFGADRFYLGKMGTAWAKLVTVGGVGFWWLADVIVVLTGNATDSQGRAVTGDAEERRHSFLGTAFFVIAGITLASATTVTAYKSSTTPTADPQADPAPTATTTQDPRTDAMREWAKDEYGSFRSFVESGHGDATIQLPNDVSAGIIQATHDGTQPFLLSVAGIGDTGRATLITGQGAVAATEVFGASGGVSRADSINLTADGDWKLEFRPMDSARVFTGRSEQRSDGVLLTDGAYDSAALKYDGPEEPRIRAHQNGKAHYLTTGFDKESDQLQLPSGKAVVVVHSKEPWSLSANEGTGPAGAGS